MKKTSLTMLLMLSLLLTACGGADDGASDDVEDAASSDMKRYGVESGMVEYELSGSKTGTKTIYWDNWGMREATYQDSVIEVSGMTIPDKNVTIMDGDWMYSYNPDDRTGTKMVNTMIKQILENSGEDDLGELGLHMLKGMGGKKVGTESIAGKTCDLYEVSSMSTQTCVWKSVTLKTEANLAGMNITELATIVDTSTAVPEEKFTLPEDIAIKDLGNLDDLMKKF